MADERRQELPITKIEPETDKILAIEMDRIRPNPFQPRKEISSAKIDELALSIKTAGLIQPIVVRKAGSVYQLVVGERRFLACRKLGWKKINAAVKLFSDNDMATTALIENLQRENLNIIDEANAYVRLMKVFSFTQEQLARQLGKSQSTIANKIRLLKLSETVRSKLVRSELSERHARALLKLSSEEEQLVMIDEIIQKGLNVNQAEKRIESLTGEYKEANRRKKAKPIIKDLRIVLNTIREAVRMIKNSGLNPEVEEIVDKEYIEVKIRLTKDMLKK